MKYKKKLTSFLLLFALLSSFLPAHAVGPNGMIPIELHNESTGRYENASAEIVNLSLDGAEMDLTADVPALAVGGRTMVPVRTVGEPLGATILWSQENNQVILRRATNTVVLTLGSASALVNGVKTPLPDGVPACVVKYQGVERTMVPLRFVSEQLGAAVSWVQETFTASIVRPSEVSTRVTRVSADSDRQTVLIATDRTPEYKIVDLGNRIAVDVLGAELASGFPGTISVDNDFITTVRYAQHGSDLYPDYAKTFRVTLDLRQGITLAKNIKAALTDEGILLTTFLTEADREDTAPVIPPTPVDPAKKTIVIDAGHGGSRSGAVYEGIQEKDINLSVSLKLEALLKNAGYNVVMTRTTDVYMGLYERADLANAVGADLFVSIHSNAFKDPAIHGVLTYYHPSSGRGKRLAQAIQGPICSATGAQNKGISSADFVVLRETDMCAVLVEMGFMTNHDELMRLNDNTYQDKLAAGITAGIISYLKS